MHFVFVKRESCNEQVNGYSNCQFKKFATAEEANAFANVKPDTYYGVSNGRDTGVYKSWWVLFDYDFFGIGFRKLLFGVFFLFRHEAEAQVKGYSNASYRKFESYDAAQHFASGGNGNA